MGLGFAQPMLGGGGGVEPPPHQGGYNPPTPTPAQPGQASAQAPFSPPPKHIVQAAPELRCRGGCRARGEKLHIHISWAGLAPMWSLILYPPDATANVCWVGRVSVTHGTFCEAL